MVVVVEEVEKDAAEGTVPETARGCLLRRRRASNGGVTRSTQSDGGASCSGYRFPVRFSADNLDPAPPESPSPPLARSLLRFSRAFRRNRVKLSRRNMSNAKASLKLLTYSLFSLPLLILRIRHFRKLYREWNSISERLQACWIS